MKKITKLFGVLLSAMLVVSMFVMAIPVAAADPGNIEWTSQSLPGSSMMELDSDVADIAVASDGSTIYVSDNEAAGVDNPVAGDVFKSTNAGQSFSDLEEYQEIAGVGAPVAIAVAPDDEDAIAVVDDNGTVHTSNDGGSSWSSLPAIADGLAVDVAIGPSRSGTALGREYFVAVVDIVAADVGAGDVLTIGDTLTWTSISTADIGGVYDCVAVAVSPGYLGDRVVVVVGATATATEAAVIFVKVDTSNPGLGEEIATAPFDDATGVTIDWDDGVTANGIISADIALPNDFDPTSGSGRVAFVGIVSAGEPADNDAYRIEDDDAYDLDIGSSGTGISSVSYSGTIDEGMLFAGESGDNVVNATDEVDDNSPDWDDESPIGTNGTIVRAASDYADSQTVFAGTSGDQSAFSISVEGGKYYGESLIDNDVAGNVVEIDDIILTPDSETIFMGTNVADETFSLWRSSVPSSSTSWSLLKQVDDGTDTYDGTLLAVNPDYDNDPTVLWAVEDNNKSGAPFYVSQNGGDSFSGKTAPGDDAPVLAIAVEDDQTFYAAGDTNIYKTTNAAWYWEDPVDAKAGVITNIEVPMADWLLIGGHGEVSYSDDGGESFEDESGNLNADKDYVVTAHEDFADNMIIFACTQELGTTANADTVYSFEIEESIDWEDMLSDGEDCIGAEYLNGTLYSMAFDNIADRTINATATAGTVAWQYLDEGTTTGDVAWSFDAAEIDGENILFAAGENAACDPKIWAYNDWLATTVPQLTFPPDNYELPINPNNGFGLPVELMWESLGSGSGLVNEWDIAIAEEDVGFSGGTTLPDKGTSATSPSVDSADVVTNLYANKTYLWRVRASGTVGGEDDTRSPWSEERTIKVQSGTIVNQPYAGPILTGPAGGAQDVNPTLVGFSWAPVPGATEYQVIVATDAALTATVGGTPATVTGNSYQVTGLDYGTTYFWAVMAVEPTVSPQNTGTFTTMMEGAPPVTVEPQPTPTIVMPDTSTPAYIWAVIVIGAVLVIAVIVLIVRTRRVT